jgi:hypothetical protein
MNESNVDFVSFHANHDLLATNHALMTSTEDNTQCVQNNGLLSSLSAQQNVNNTNQSSKKKRKQYFKVFYQ